MKIQPFSFHQDRPERGSAVIVILGMLAIMMIFLTLNTVALNHLNRELKLSEKKQVQRLRSDSMQHP